MKEMQSNLNMLRAVGYKRVSMHDQVDGFSLDAQENNIKKYIEKQGWQLIEIYEDAGISAKKGTHRPAFERLLKDAHNGKYDVVVVDKIDRFYRHLNGLLTTLDQLNEDNIAFASVQEQMDFTSPWGKLILNVLGTLAEIYIDNLRQEVRKGKKQRARQGLWLGSIPYGYCKGLCHNCQNANGKDYCPNFGKENLGDGKVLLAHPIESGIVKMVFDLYLTGEESHRSIAKHLNQLKISIPNGKIIEVRQRGAPGRTPPGPFSRDIIRDMLKRIAYTGKLAYRGIDKNGVHKKRTEPQLLFEGQHPALITEDIYQEAQEIRELRSSNSYMKNNQRVRIYPLTGILHCGYCGGGMRGVSNAYRRYYSDGNQLDQICDCPQITIRADEIEANIIHWIKHVYRVAVSDKEYAFKKQADFYQKKFQRAKELYILGEISSKRLEDVREKTKDIISILHKTKLNDKMKFISETQQQLDRWNELSNLKRKRLLRLIIEAVFMRGNAFVAFQPTLAFQILTQSQETYSRPCSCGEGGIRTRGRGNPDTHLAGGPNQPLWHLPNKLLILGKK